MFAEATGDSDRKSDDKYGRRSSNGASGIVIKRKSSLSFSCLKTYDWSTLRLSPIQSGQSAGTIELVLVRDRTSRRFSFSVMSEIGGALDAAELLLATPGLGLFLGHKVSIRCVPATIGSEESPVALGTV